MVGVKHVPVRETAGPNATHATCKRFAEFCTAGSTTIGSVRVLAERLFKVKAARQALALRLPGDAHRRSLGSDDTQSLSFFAIEVFLECFTIISHGLRRHSNYSRDMETAVQHSISAATLGRRSHALCILQEGSEILVIEEDVVARVAETEAMKRADAALRERCMDQQLRART